VDAFAGSETYSGERVTIPGALGLVAVFGAVSKIAETIGSLPLKVYRDLDGERVEASDHRAYRMLHDMPNPLSPSHRFWSTVVGHLLLWGNAFVRKERDQNGLVATLWALEPSQMSVEWNTKEQRKRFAYTGADGVRTVLPDDEVLHILDFSLNGIVGESRISRCRQGIGTALARQRFEGNFYGRGAVMGGVIEYPGSLKDTIKLRESWTAIYGGAKQAHGVGVLEEGATFRPLTAPLRDLEFVESARLSNTDVAILFGIPPSYLGGSTGDSLTYSTVEGNKIQFADALTPICTNIAKALATDRGIFPFSAWFPEFEMKALLRGDSHARAEFYKTMSDIGAMTIDEIRALENLPPLGYEPAPAAVPASTEEAT
jgi:HK97 family phage portal protein